MTGLRSLHYLMGEAREMVLLLGLIKTKQKNHSAEEEGKGRDRAGSSMEGS